MNEKSKTEKTAFGLTKEKSCETMEDYVLIPIVLLSIVGIVILIKEACTHTFDK